MWGLLVAFGVGGVFLEETDGPRNPNYEVYMAPTIGIVLVSLEAYSVFGYLDPRHPSTCRRRSQGPSTFCFKSLIM